MLTNYFISLKNKALVIWMFSNGRREDAVPHTNTYIVWVRIMVSIAYLIGTTTIGKNTKYILTKLVC